MRANFQLGSDFGESAKAIHMSNHRWPEISAGLLCCTPTAHWLEYADWWNPIVAAPLHIEKGMAIVDDSPGSERRCGYSSPDLMCPRRFGRAEPTRAPQHSETEPARSAIRPEPLLVLA